MESIFKQAQHRFWALEDVIPQFPIDGKENCKFEVKSESLDFIGFRYSSCYENE